MRAVTTHPSNPPPLGLIGVVEERARVAKHLGGKLGGQVLYGQAMVGVAEDLGRLVHERRLRHGWWHLEASHVVVHGGQVGRPAGWVGSGAQVRSWDCLKWALEGGGRDGSWWSFEMGRGESWRNCRMSSWWWYGSEWQGGKDVGVGLYFVGGRAGHITCSAVGTCCRFTPPR